MLKTSPLVSFLLNAFSLMAAYLREVQAFLCGVEYQEKVQGHSDRVIVIVAQTLLKKLVVGKCDHAVGSFLYVSFDAIDLSCIPFAPAPSQAVCARFASSNESFFD